MFGKLIIPMVEEYIQSGAMDDLKEIMLELEPADIADIIETAEEDEKHLIFNILPKDIASDVFNYLEYDSQLALIDNLNAEDISFMMNEMAPDDRTELLEELPEDVAEMLINKMSDEEKEVSRRLLDFPEDSIGRLITTDYISVNPESTIAEAFEHIRNYGQDSETINHIYILNDQQHLVDDLTIRQLIFAEPTAKISSLMYYKAITLKPEDDKETAIDVFKKYDRTALPVVDENDIMLGIITIDDVLDVAEEEATEDIQKLGGMEYMEDSYTKIGFFGMIKKRAVWLSLLFLGEMLTSTAMGFFEAEISRAVILALFIPLIISSGGNSGSQAATLIVRSLALKELALRDWFYVLRREILSGLILGTLLATIGFLRISLWELMFHIYGPHWMLIAFTVGFSLIGVVTWGTFAGGMLPIILKSLKLDPATSSAPFVATLVDVVGIVIYFSIAMLILHNVYFV